MRVIARGETNLMERWNCRFDFASVPTPGPFFVSLHQIAVGLDNEELNIAHLDNQQILTIENDGTVNKSTFDLSLLDSIGESSVTHGFVQLRGPFATQF
jgi:hypothetical protein